MLETRLLRVPPLNMRGFYVSGKLLPVWYRCPLCIYEVSKHRQLGLISFGRSDGQARWWGATRQLTRMTPQRLRVCAVLRRICVGCNKGKVLQCNYAYFMLCKYDLFISSHQCTLKGTGLGQREDKLQPCSVSNPGTIDLSLTRPSPRLNTDSFVQ